MPAAQPIRFKIQNYADAEQLAMQQVRSEHSKYAYGKVYRYFRGHVLSARAISGYINSLREEGKSPATLNLHLDALRTLAKNAELIGLISAAELTAILRIKRTPIHGVRIGTWLDRDQARALLEAPPADTPFGIRDRALLWILVSAGLRRSEAAQLTWGHIQVREGRTLIVDLIGKRGRVRSVPLSARCVEAIDNWRRIAEPKDPAELLFAGVGVGGIYKRVLMWSEAIGIKIAPHDLRRTFAHLARKGNAPIEQIQFALGHASVQTTERYLGGSLDLVNAVCDKLDL